MNTTTSKVENSAQVLSSQLKFVHATNSSLYYKHITIVNDDSSIINKFGATFTDEARVVIYDCQMFIVQWPVL
jgi:hypothetical protein